MKILRYDNRELFDATITVKLDGIQCMLKDGCVVSRKGKPLYGIDAAWLIEGHIYEVYCGSFSQTVTNIRTKSARPIDRDSLYSISPIDERLVIAFHNEINFPMVESYMQKAVMSGHEGLVIHTPKTLWKVKTSYTYDVRITGLIAGNNKYTGKLGAFKTAGGKVGTGFTDEQRSELNSESMIGQIIEVECMELTEDGKFRHPRFIRHRFDKNTESIE